MNPEFLHTVNVWAAVSVCFIFSITFIYLLYKSSRPESKISFNILLVVGVAMLVSVGLVGSAPIISTIQSVCVALGTLFALYVHIRDAKKPDVKIVVALATVMITSTVLSQFSQREGTGLLRWFGVELYTSAATEVKQKIDSVQGELEQLKSTVVTDEDLKNLRTELLKQDKVTLSVASESSASSYAEMKTSVDAISAAMDKLKNVDESLTTQIDDLQRSTGSVIATLQTAVAIVTDEATNAGIDTKQGRDDITDGRTRLDLVRTGEFSISLGEQKSIDNDAIGLFYVLVPAESGGFLSSNTSEFNQLRVVDMRKNESIAQISKPSLGLNFMIEPRDKRFQWACTVIQSGNNLKFRWTEIRP